jgi:DNA invertase Pin-like site-specific DNA recombinase
VSTDAQCGEDRYGLDAQKNDVMEYCSKHDMQVSEWYVDEGESGAKDGRPALDELLYGEVKNPPVTAVIVPKSDRMARDIKLYFYYMMVLERKNMRLISATEEVVNDDTGLGNVYKALILFVAEQERKNITKRTSGGRKIKASRGGYSGGRPPYGYKPVDGKLIIVPEEAEIVRFVIDSKNDGMTYQQICDHLNQEGKRNRSGSKFSISTLQVIIENEPLYRGQYRYGKGAEWIRGQHEPILKDGD